MKTGWWSLDITGVDYDDLEEFQLEYIGKKIEEGFTSGQVLIPEEEDGA
jgi:hypothetical protein